MYIIKYTNLGRLNENIVLFNLLEEFKIDAGVMLIYYNKISLTILISFTLPATSYSVERSFRW